MTTATSKPAPTALKTETLNTTATNLDRPNEAWVITSVAIQAADSKGAIDLRSRGWTHIGSVRRLNSRAVYMALVNLDRRVFSRVA